MDAEVAAAPTTGSGELPVGAEVAAAPSTGFALAGVLVGLLVLLRPMSYPGMASAAARPANAISRAPGVSPSLPYTVTLT